MISINPYFYGMAYFCGTIMKFKSIRSSASEFTPAEVNLSANGVICCYDPTNPAYPPYQFTTLNDEIANYNFTQTFEMDIALNVNQQALAAKYQHSILFISVASKSADGKVGQNSATYTKLS